MKMFITSKNKYIYENIWNMFQSFNTKQRQWVPPPLKIYRQLVSEEVSFSPNQCQLVMACKCLSGFL